MNLYDLLNVIGEAKESFVLEAIESRDRKSTKRMSMRRPLLIAAIVAIMLLLVGCAVVYVLRLQDMSVGKETYTQNFDDSGKAIDPIEKEQDVLTLFGHSGDPIQQATKEWFDFLETYDPDGALMDNSPDNPEIPNQYEYTYFCYTKEMMNKTRWWTPRRMDCGFGPGGWKVDVRYNPGEYGLQGDYTGGSTGYYGPIPQNIAGLEAFEGLSVV